MFSIGLALDLAIVLGLALVPGVAFGHAQCCKTKGMLDEDGRISYVDFVNKEMPD